MNGFTFKGWIASINGEPHSSGIFDTEEDAIADAIACCELGGFDADITTEYVDEVLSAEQMKQVLDPYLDESDYAD